MRVSVTPRFVRGQLVADRLTSNIRPVIGDLRVEWLMVPQRSRYVKFATLLEETPGGMGKPLLPNLLDCELLGVVTRIISLTGFERIDGVEYRQSWIVEVQVR